MLGSPNRIPAVPIMFEDEDNDSLQILYILSPRRLLAFLVKILPRDQLEVFKNPEI